jgi:hypothetical protein
MSDMTRRSSRRVNARAAARAQARGEGLEARGKCGRPWLG